MLTNFSELLIVGKGLPTYLGERIRGSLFLSVVD